MLASAQAVANQALQTPEVLTTVTGTNGAAFTAGSTIASNSGSSTRLKTGDTVTVSDGTTTATYTAANNDTIQTLLNAVNNTANLNVTAALNASGQLQFTATSNVNITIGGTLSGAGGGTLNGILGLNAGITNYTPNTARSQLATQFDSLLAQIDQTALDAGFDGVNLLAGSSSSVTLNETGTANLTITGALATSGGLGVAAASNGFQLSSDINTALTNVTNALTSLQSMSVSYQFDGVDHANPRRLQPGDDRHAEYRCGRVDGQRSGRRRRRPACPTNAATARSRIAVSDGGR